MIEYETKQLCGTPVLIGFEMQEMIQDGWEIDPALPLGIHFTALDVWMRRSTEDLDKVTPKIADTGDYAGMTDAQIRMAKARAARKGK